MGSVVGDQKNEVCSPIPCDKTRCFRKMLGICVIIYAAGKFLLYPRLVPAQKYDALDL